MGGRPEGRSRLSRAGDFFWYNEGKNRKQEKEDTMTPEQKERLAALPKEKLIELIEIYAKDWLAMDGVWFQSVEKAFGMDTAMKHDVEIWEKFTVIEAMKIRKFLGLSDRPGLDGLEKALRFRLYGNINREEIFRDGPALIYRTLSCRVQHARESKGMPFHPCLSVGIVEYGGFARTIDPRIRCEYISCYPEITDSTCHCAWKFTLAEE